MQYNECKSLDSDEPTNYKIMIVTEKVLPWD